MDGIALALDELLGADTELVAWDNLPPDKQQQIQRALATQTFPSYLVSPKTQQQLAKLISLAQDRNWQILTCGSGSKLGWGGLVSQADLVVSTQHLNRIIDHAVADLTVTVEAGVTLKQLQDTLKSTGQFLPLDPAYPETATVGGIMATADAGSWRQGYGGVRDLVLGLSFVRADGQIAKAGGRVVKNVAGYDLMKLFTGSYGTLGIISQITFRTYPLPETSATVILTGAAEKLSKAASTLLNSSLTPTSLDLLSAGVVKALNLGAGMGLLVRFQSIAASVKQQSEQVRELALSLDLKVDSFSGNDRADLWEQLSQTIRKSATESTVICKIGILPDAAVEFLEKLDLWSNQSGLGQISVGSGLGNLQLVSDNLELLKKLRLHCSEHRGFLSILESPVAFKQKIEPWGYTGNSLGMMQKIKQQFDPKNIFNPGRYF